MSPAVPALVGRESHWEALLAAYTAVDDSGHLVLIEGEAGAGKTKLSQTFAAYVRTTGATVACGVCYAGEETLAFASNRASAAADIGGSRCARPPAGYRTRMAAGAAALVTRVARRSRLPARTRCTRQPGPFFGGIACSLASLLYGSQPGVLVLDDLQFVDGATLDLLAYMLRRLQTLPLLVIVTWCTSEVSPNHRLRQMIAEAARRKAATLLTLSPLDEHAIEALLATGVDAQLPGNPDRTESARRLHAETSGLPLFVGMISRPAAQSRA